MSTYLSHLSQPQVTVLVLCSIGIVLAQSRGLTTVAIMLAYLLDRGERAMRRQIDRWWLVVLEGAAGIILGVLTFRSPDTTALVLLTLIAAWSIVSGIFEIATALRIRTMIENEWLLLLSGVVSIVFGALLIAQPGAGEIAIVWLLGGYALLFGILLLVLAFRLRGMRDTMGRQASGAV